MTEEIHVTGIGNAIVDVLARTEDQFLIDNKLTKGSMALINEEEAHNLYQKMGSGLECSGGSAGNTMAGLASLGGKGAYIGKVKNDQLGEVFAHDMRAGGTIFETPPAADGPATARCLILVTPDAQRTMNTYLGACVSLGPDDIDERLIKRSKVTYMEGYLWDPPAAKEAFIKAAKIAHQSNRKVSISLSDSFCVDRHRESFRELVNDHIDILFANEDEIKSLYQVESFEAARDAVRGRCETAVLTRSEKGSVVLHQGEEFTVPAEPVAEVVDTTGAGDLYAGGFLFGYTQGKSMAESAKIGSICAAEVISHYGARPENSLAELVAKKL